MSYENSNTSSWYWLKTREPFPKPLTDLKNGKSIMQMQTENIASKYNIDDVNVVVGFKKDLIMERFPELSYVYNPFFDRTNTSKSLLQV